MIVFQAFPVTGQLPSVHAADTFLSHAKKPFGFISNLWLVQWSSVFGYLKEKQLKSNLGYNLAKDIALNTVKILATSFA